MEKDKPLSFWAFDEDRNSNFGVFFDNMMRRHWLPMIFAFDIGTRSIFPAATLNLTALQVLIWTNSWFLLTWLICFRALEPVIRKMERNQSPKSVKNKGGKNGRI